jgi:DNA-binding IclR family transcriptional regulator
MVERARDCADLSRRGGPISLRRVKQSLRCPESIVRRVLRDLEREGLTQPVDDHLESSLKGSALAQATAARPLVRSTAQRPVAELVLRAR